MMSRSLFRSTAATVGFLVVGCGQPDRNEAVVDAEGDTVPAVQPVSPAEIQRRAEPMTPEEAEQRGVVDTTIRVTKEP